MSDVINLGLGPTTEPMTTELLQQAEVVWREKPNSPWYKGRLGLGQLRAGQYREAVASLEVSLSATNRWQEDGMNWSLLAIAHHHLGNKDEARRWLNKTTLWLQLRKEAESRRVGAATGVADIKPEDLLFAMVFYREAKTLIEGPQPEPQTN